MSNHIATSTLTNTIFCGKVLKDGKTWAKGKEDLTLEALIAVAEHALRFKQKTGENILITDSTGNIEFEIEVSDYRKQRQDKRK